MKRIALILTFIFITFTGLAQSTWTVPQFLGGAKNLVTVPGGLNVPNGLILGTFADTNALNLNSSKFYEGSYADVAGVLHRRTNNRWVAAGGVSISSYSKNVTRDSTVLLLSNGTRFAAKDSLGSGDGAYPGNTDTTDGLNNPFITQTVPAGLKYTRIARSEPLDLFVTTSNNTNSYHRYATSNDGVTWVDRVWPGTNYNSISRDVRWIQERSIFIEQHQDTLLSSTDGINWSFLSKLGFNIRNFEYINELDLYVTFVSTSGGISKIFTSPDGVIWTERVHPHPTVPLWNRLAWSPQLNLMVCMSNNIAAPGGLAKWISSSDGITWTSLTPTTATINFSALNWLPTQNKFVAYAPLSSKLVQSTDGINWTEQIYSPPNANYIPYYIPEKGLLITHNNLQTYTSVDGITWTSAGTVPAGASYGVFSYSSSRKITVLTGNAMLSLQSPVVGIFSATKEGLVPRSAGLTANYLRGDGIWAPQEVNATGAIKLTNKEIVPRAVNFATLNGSFGLFYTNFDGNSIVLNGSTAIDAPNYPSPTPPPYEGQEYYLKIGDDGTARALTWTGSVRAGTITLPTTTVPGRTIHLRFMWDSRVNKWDLIFKTESY